MGYGASSKGGGGSGSAGGGKKKQGGKKQKPRTFKVKEKATQRGEIAASYAPPPAPAFTVQAPKPEHRARLLAGRWREEQLVTAARRKCNPVNGTTPNGRVLGSSSGSAVVADEIISEQKQPQQQQTPTNREARQSFLAAQEAKIEAERCRREETKNAKRRATELQFSPQIALAKQQWDALASRLPLDNNGNEQETQLGEIRRLLEIVLRNAATKSDPKYKRLNASKNHNLWTRLLRFEEVVAILEEGAGFERREAATNEVELERGRIHLKLAQALDSHEASLSSSGPNNNDSNPAAIASLAAELDALGIATSGCQELAATKGDDDDKARDFELYHAGVGADGLGLKRIFALLRAVESWQL